MGDARIGVYFCTCEGEIDGTVALGQLAGDASAMADVAVVRTGRSLCSREAAGAIRADVDKLGLDRVVIAACSPFVNPRAFDDLGVGPELVERVNIREQCSRVHGDNPDHASRKAAALLQLSVDKARRARPGRTVTVPTSRSALVVGGGVAGINAALDLAHAGVEVVLVEKEPTLGGHAATLHKYFPRMCPPSCGLDLMIGELEMNPRIDVLTSSEVASLGGSPGNFSVSVRSACAAAGDDDGAEPRSFTVGAVVVATGWEPFDPTPLGGYGYGLIRNVVTNLEFEKLAREDRSLLTRPTRTAFIQCVGSRDERHLPYCSDVCCTVSIKQALLLKQADPLNEAYVFYNDIRTPGDYEQFYRRARASGVAFIKGMPSELRQGEQGQIGFSVVDTLAGERRDMVVDRVVLATGMKPAVGGALADAIGLTLNPYGYVESHVQCHPLDSQRAGIFAAGCCRAPMDVSRSVESAGAAAMKALRVLNREKVLGPGLPEVDLLKCDRCKRCMQECPYQAYLFDESGFPSVDAAKCRQCGICMGSCPLGAISVGDLSIEQLSSMLDALDKSYLGEDEPIVLGFLCGNDAYRAADDAAGRGLRYPPNFVGVMVPCSGAVNGAIVAEAISKGIDGVMVAGCPDVQCHYVAGSALAKERLEAIAGKLKEMYLEPERVKFASIERDDPEKFCETVDDFVRTLKAMGRNPLRIL